MDFQVSTMGVRGILEAFQEDSECIRRYSNTTQPFLNSSSRRLLLQSVQSTNIHDRYFSFRYQYGWLAAHGSDDADLMIFISHDWMIPLKFSRTTKSQLFPTIYPVLPVIRTLCSTEQWNLMRIVSRPGIKRERLPLGPFDMAAMVWWSGALFHKVRKSSGLVIVQPRSERGKKNVIYYERITVTNSLQNWIFNEDNGGKRNEGLKEYEPHVSRSFGR